MGEAKQLLVVETDQRPLEHRRQGQVVGGKQDEPADGHQVHHRHLFGQHHSVDAGDGDAEQFQRPHQFLDEQGAAAHQNHDVSWPDRASRRFHQFGPGGHCLDAPGDQEGEARLRRIARDPLDRRFPRRRRIGGLGVHRRPYLHRPAVPLAEGLMHDDVAVEGDPVGGAVGGEYGIHSGEHRAGRAEGNLHRDEPPDPAGPGDPGLEPFVVGEELIRIGSLEAEDGLFDVADGEHGAVDLPGALSGEELGGQRADDLPLLGTGVLGLVDQHVVDAAVELVQHPRRVAFLLQQPHGMEDQVVVVEQRAGALEPLIGLQQGMTDHQERGCGAGGRRRPALHDRREQPFALVLHDPDHARNRRRRLLGDQALAHGRRIAAGEINAGVTVERLRPIMRGPFQPAGDGGRPPGVGFRARVQGRDRAA